LNYRLDYLEAQNGKLRNKVLELDGGRGVDVVVFGGN
jgi:hypothetical protein